MKQNNQSSGVQVTNTPNVAVTSIPNVTVSSVTAGTITTITNPVFTKGVDAIEADPTVNPVFVGGKDCAGHIQPLPVCTTKPTDTALGAFVRPVPQQVSRYGFHSLILDTSTDWQLLQTGAGMAISQTGGSLVITTGTTANAETVYRLRVPRLDAWILRYALTLSQRIAENNFFVEMVDVIGDGLTVTNSGTTVVVTKNNHGLEVGQTIQISCVANVSGGTIIPGAWAITAADANTFTFTATGSSGTGTGTCSITSWNSVYVCYKGTTATNAAFTTRRNGWFSAETTATINTSASGHNGIIQLTDGLASYADTTINSTSTVSSRAGRTANVPGDTTNLYLQIRALNGTSNPATTTTLTLNMVQLESFSTMPVSIMEGRNTGIPNQLQVAVTTAPTTTVSGAAAHSATASGNPVWVGGVVRTAAASGDANGEIAALKMSTDSQAVVLPYNTPDQSWSVADSITNSTTAVVLKIATASYRNYIVGMTLSHSALADVTVLQIRDTPQASPSATISANTLVMASTFNWKIGDKMYIVSSDVTGLTAGSYVYILTVSTTSLTFTAARGGTTLSISGTNKTATIAKVHAEYQLTAAALQPVELNFPIPTYSGTALPVEITTLTARTGTINFNVQGYVAL